MILGQAGLVPRDQNNSPLTSTIFPPKAVFKTFVDLISDCHGNDQSAHIENGHVGEDIFDQS
jgi:hypothetical protein